MMYHSPVFDTKAIEEIYTAKDGVPVKYVCSTAKGDESYAWDIFYRDTPHPRFGNKYFGLYTQKMIGPTITNADWVEDLTFDMIECDGVYYYSKHRHDFVQTLIGFIDGGRAYTRLGGNPVPKATQFKVINGEFVKQ